MMAASRGHRSASRRFRCDAIGRDGASERGREGGNAGALISGHAPGRRLATQTLGALLLSSLAPRGGDAGSARAEMVAIADKGAAFQGRVLSTARGAPATPEALADAGGLPGELACFFVVPERWRMQNGGGPESETRVIAGRPVSSYTWRGFSDPVTNAPILNAVTVTVSQLAPASSTPPDADITTLGPPDRLPAELPLLDRDATLSADIVRAEKSRRLASRGGAGPSSDPTTFYDWELALDPGACDAEERRMLGVCPYKQAKLVSSFVWANQIAALTIDVDVPQFQRYQGDIRNAVRSFALLPPPASERESE